MNKLNDTIFKYSNLFDKIKEFFRLYHLDDQKYNQFIDIYIDKSEKLANISKGCLFIINNRENTYKIICNLKKHILGNETEEIEKFLLNYQGIKIPMFDASVLSTTSYLSCSWSLYDSIQRIILIIIGNQIPDITHSFCNKNSSFSNLSCYNLYKLIYSDDYIFSYKLRNFFIHEAGFINGKSILLNNKVRDLFTINDSLLNEINDKIGKELVFKGNLIDQLKNANDNIDCFFCSLLNHSIDSYFKEILSFIDEDKFKRQFLKILQ